MTDNSVFNLGVLGLCCQAIIGIHPHERDAPQPLEIDVSVDVALKKLEDAIDLTFSYSVIPGIILEAAEKNLYLIETLAESIAEKTLSKDHRIIRVEIEIRKLKAIPGARASFVKIARDRLFLEKAKAASL